MSPRPALLLLLMACQPDPADSADPPDSPPDETDVEPVGDPTRLCQAVVTCDGEVADEPKTPCVLSIVDAEGVDVYDGPAGFELRGRSSLSFPKPQYAVELRDQGGFVVRPGAVWRYLDTGVDPGPGWVEPGFDDSAWASGAAPLGYAADEATTLSFGDDPLDRHPTTWFRLPFTWSDAEPPKRLTLRIVRDDGVAVYLNGTEVVRDNLAPGAGPADYATLAIGDDEEGTWLSFDVGEPGLVVEGDNVLAVEVHQSDADSSDLAFDLGAEVIGDPVEDDLFGFGGDDDWILNGVWIDRVLFRNKLAYDLFQSFGGPERYAPESMWCELEVDGDYRGIYTLGERIERGVDRVDIPATERSGETFIVKLGDDPLIEDGGRGLRANTVGYGTWELVFPDPDDPGAADRARNLIAQWEQAVAAGDEGAVFALMDLDSAVDYVLLQEFTRNNDAYQLSVHLARGEDQKLRFVPWDFDLTFGYPYYDCGWEQWIDVREPWVDAITAMPAFRARAVARWGELRQGPLAADAILDRIAAYDATLAPAIDRNFERWPIDEVEFVFADTSWLCPVTSYDDEHARVLAFVQGRLAWMDEHVDELGAN